MMQHVQWQRLPVSGPQASSVWVWHLAQQPSEEEQGQAEKVWEAIDPTDLKTPFLALISQLVMTKTVLTRTGGKIKTLVKAADLEQVRQHPIILAFQTSDDRSPDAFPPPHIGELGLAVEGEALHRYSLSMLGEAGVEVCQQLQETLASSQVHTDAFTPDETAWREAQRLAGELAALYWKTHQEALHSQQPRSMPATSYLVESSVLIISALPVQAALAAFSNAQSGATAWHTEHHLPTFTHQKAEGTAHVQVRPPDLTSVVDESTVHELWKQVGKLSDLHGDVLLAMLAHVLATTPDNRGGVWVSSRDILEHRGLKPKTHKEANGQKRKAGHRLEDLMDIAMCIGHLSNTWVQVNQWIAPSDEVEGQGPNSAPYRRAGKKKRQRKQNEQVLFTRESRLINVEDVVTQFSFDFAGSASARTNKRSVHHPPVPIAWRYRLGSWVDPFLLEPNRRFAFLLQKALSYDPYHQMWEKRLDRYFIFHMRVNAAGGGTTIERAIGELLQELTLKIDERNPERTRDRFEKALNVLLEDRQIDDWRYVEDIAQLSPRGWMPRWLQYHVRVYVAPLGEQVGEHYERLLPEE